MYADRFRDSAAILTNLSYIEAMATTGNLFLVSDLLKSWLSTVNSLARADPSVLAAANRSSSKQSSSRQDGSLEFAAGLNLDGDPFDSGNDEGDEDNDSEGEAGARKTGDKVSLK